ncbi:MAG TPA: hypothetical protein VLB07_09880 [Woeseiaceae bacterium]|nr:hypothetical protein [Woeseiaceae bacterium]
MKPSELAREIAYPLTQAVMLLALLFFSGLLLLANRAGLLGMFLLLIAAPAFARYLLAILDARTHGRQPEPPSLEMFSLVDSLWTLFPLVPVAAVVWLEILLSGEPGTGNTRAMIAASPMLAFVVLMPASLTILTMTRSPLASINPLLIGRVMARSAPAYLLIPLAMIAVSAALHGLSLAGLPAALLDLGVAYQLFLLCSLTGAVMHRAGIEVEVDIPDARAIDQPAQERKLLEERQAVANHAYGFISRGNRDGGLKHIRDGIDAETDVDDAWRWYFEEMSRWESNDAVLFFAQAYLGRLLRLCQEAEALRVVTRCLHRNPRFRPWDEDRELLSSLLKRRNRQDLLAQLER